MGVGTPIYYVDLTARTGVAIEDALAEAHEIETRRQAAGFDQQALELAAREALANGAFEDSEDEGAEVVEEFFTQERSDIERPLSENNPLLSKLEKKAGIALVDSLTT